MVLESISFSTLFFNEVKKPLREKVSLQDYSNFQIGGPADFFFEASSLQEFVKSILLARKYSLSHYVIGGGNNLLFDDDGFRGLIIRNAARRIKHGQRKGEIDVLSGTPLAELVQFSLEEEMSGFEFLAGIPGTVGGAVYSNAGAFNRSIGDFLKTAIILDEKGDQIRVNKNYFEFDYRQSILKKKGNILLKVLFELQEARRKEIQSQIEENLGIRKRSHPSQEIAYAGSYFKNPVLPNGRKIPAAQLLDRVGAKKIKIGGAGVYSGHANFIINLGGARARDVLQLASELKKRVREEFEIDLEEEVIFLPAKSPSS